MSTAGATADPGARRGRNTAVFAIATGASRVTALVREVLAAKYFGVSAQMSAFTIAFQVPNLMRALFADFALQGAFIPVFTELLERGKRREAFHVASSVVFLACLVLGALTALVVLVAPLVVRLVAPGFADEPALTDLTVALTRIMMPTVLLLALSGLVAGMLNSFDHFTAPALAPVAWNLAIVAVLVAAMPLFPPEDEIYAYALGVVVGTFVQFALPLPWLRGRGGRFTLALDWRNRHVRRVLKLMLPVTLTLGLFQISLLLNSLLGTLVSEQAPAAIDRAFRIVVLPQGVFSLAVVTILFPTLSRLAARGAFDELRRTMATGVREICLLTIPSAVALSVLAVPVTRLVYERGSFDAEATSLVADALAIWALTLPFQGVATLFSQTFFSLQRPWTVSSVAAGYVVFSLAVGLALHGPLGITGIVLGTVSANVVMTVVQAVLLRRFIGGVDGQWILGGAARMLVAGAAFAGVSYGLWVTLDAVFARSFAGQLASVGAALAGGAAVYLGAVALLRVQEVDRLKALVRRSIGGREPGPPQ